MSNGLRALVGTTVLSNALRLVSNIMLARWLSPEAFALTGIVMTIVFAFEMFSDGGFKSFLLRHKKGEDAIFLGSIWTVRLVRGICLGVLFFLFSGLVASLFNIPDLNLALQVTSLMFFISAFEPISFLLAERRGQITKVLNAEFFIYVMVISITVLGVWFTQSYWFLIWGAVLNALLRVAVGYLLFGSHGSFFAFNKRYIKELMGWVKYIIPSSIITLLLVQLDKIVLGRTLTVEELGLYFVAFNFSAAAFHFVINYARRVLEPYMAKIYRVSPDDFKIEFYKKKTLISSILACFIGMGIGGASVFFDIFYDDRYLNSGNYLSLLLIVPALALITYPGEVCLTLHGRLKMTLLANSLRLLWLFPALWLGFAYYSSMGVVVAFSTVEVFPMLYLLFKMSTLNLLDAKKELSVLIMAVVGLVFSMAISHYFFGHEFYFINNFLELL